MSNEITVVRQAIDKMAPQFKMALPKHVDVERFVRVTMTAVQNNPDLLGAERNSLYSAAMKAAQDGLLPDGREGAIIPRKGQAVWMKMVAGIMKQVRNSGEVSTWSVQTVKENDEFDYELGDNERIYHKPAKRNRGDTIGFYSIVTLKDGEKSRCYMDIDEVNAIRDRSDGYKYAIAKGKSSPWLTDPDQMGEKTVIRRHSKRLPLSTDLDGFINSDEDLFIPQEAEAVPNSAPEVITPSPETKRRPRGLQAVVDAQEVQSNPVETIDEDGVIETSAEPYDDPI